MRLGACARLGVVPEVPLATPGRNEENRTLKCYSCGFTVYRDVNAARNILAAGMRALRFGAVASASEAMVAIQRRPVDADELTQKVNAP
jgi:transposase